MTVDWKKKLIPNLPYLLFVYLFDKLCQAVRLAPGLDASEKFLHLSQGFTEAFSSGLPSLHPLDLLVGIVQEVVPEASGKSSIAVIKPGADPRTVKHVFIITDY